MASWKLVYIEVTKVLFEDVSVRRKTSLNFFNVIFFSLSKQITEQQLIKQIS